VIAPKFEDAQPFSSGLSRIKEGERYGYANKSGAVVIPATYKYAESFSEGFAVIGDDFSKVWYIDQNGNRTIPGEFAAASPFFKGLANVRMLPLGARNGARFAYIDTKGRRLFSY